MNFLVPSISQEEPTKFFLSLNLQSRLSETPWTLELEHALEKFSLPTYVDWIDQHHDYIYDYYDFKALQTRLQWAETFLIYLKDKVSNFCSQNQVSATASHVDQRQSNLYHYHLLCYQKHLMSSINNPPIRVKFNLMSTVWFVLQKPFTSLRRGIELASWKKLCATLFGFSYLELGMDPVSQQADLMRDPTKYKLYRVDGDLMFGDLAETKRLTPEPILSLRLAHVAISCMQYLYRQDPNTSLMQHHLLTWAMKSKRSPWLWRRRMRVTSMRCRKPTSWHCHGRKYSLPQSLQRSRQAFFSEAIQFSEDFYQEKEIFYIWTLDLLYHTLRKARKSDSLTRALSKPFIPSLAPLLFLGRIKRVRKAVKAYLEKVSQRVSF
jgi:hypothetical protein